ncbi:glycosyltransferase family 2 protein [Iningainema tapete]|uniref:Glycosyltransferase family 2 protein n=1 Tax=Iningainema tapete BLCC-T55 TaxID=2748662 RepID=A0A8J6XGR8_9CYAN|nr:glycosyltransferase family 2 protein [Iningainema tapete]MBD2771529.1 glycosyltransferase family 2 protein [Iningainema tapete BLCC-T55]
MNLNLSSSHQSDELDVQFNLANDCLRSGKLEQAIALYQKILLQEPDCIAAYLALGNILTGQGRLQEVIALYERAIGVIDNQPEFHKNLINAIVAKDGIEEAFKYYELNRVDTKEIEIQPWEILCCVVERNELLRLPYFLSYYRQKGIAKFLIVDNNSTDGSLSYLLEQSDVYTWHSTRPFSKANCGSIWLELLLRKYGVGHWCLTVDADEIFYYPDCENISIDQLCQELDKKQKTVFDAILLDMYSDKAVQDTHYTSGQNFLDVCPYFEREFYSKKEENFGNYRNHTAYWGGVRKRIFGGNDLLSKSPLIKYNVDLILHIGQHFTNRPKHEIANSRGCLLHFKFFDNFYSYVEQEVRRKEHHKNAREYVRYQQVIAQHKNLIMYDEKHSVKLQNSQQLVQMGVMQVGEISPVAVAVEFPKIYPVSTNISRPFWSVMITADKGANYLEQALKSVLEQAPSTEEMQIEVVNNTGNESIKAEIAEVVEAVGGQRIYFYHHPESVSVTQIFNICIQRASGQWVHIFHGDHIIKPGFYQHLQAGIEKEPDVGAAFCRHIHINAAGNVFKISPLERETPGVIADWLERIAMMNRLQLPSVVVKRDVYEKLGGFCQDTSSAFDWEMFNRIAVHYPVWYEPQLLVYLCENWREHPNLNYAKQVADNLKAIEIYQVYLPSKIKNKLTSKAREAQALYAFYSAQQLLHQGDYPSAIATLQQGLKCSQSAQVKQALIILLQQIKFS